LPAFSKSSGTIANTYFGSSEAAMAHAAGESNDRVLKLDFVD
jgi:hypothetical protein